MSREMECVGASKRTGSVGWLSNQLRFGFGGAAVVDAQPQGGLHATQCAGHQVEHAEGAVHPSAERRRAFRLGAGGQAAAVGGQIKQYAGLDVAVGLLDQPDLAGQRRFASQSGTLHRLAAYRLGQHVEGDGALIAPVLRFEIDDAAVLRAFARRTDAVIGMAAGAHRRDVAVQILRLHVGGEADALYAGKVLLQRQCADIGLPVFQRDVVRRVEQCARAAQHLAVGAHALFHLLRDIARLEGQALLDAFAVPTVDLVPHQIDRQHRAERGEQYGAGRSARQNGPLKLACRALRSCRALNLHFPGMSPNSGRPRCAAVSFLVRQALIDRQQARLDPVRRTNAGTPAYTCALSLSVQLQKMAQYVMSMLRVSKVVPPKRTIIKDISLSFFPGAKIGLLGLNGSGKSTVLRIMANADREYDGEVQHQPGVRIGYLPQEPELDADKTVKEEVESGLGEIVEARQKLEQIYAAYAEPDADFDKLAEEQAKYEAVLAAAGSDVETQMEIAADALRLPPWGREDRPAVRRRESVAWRCASCCCPSRTCCCWTNRPTTWTPNRWTGWNSSWCASRAPWWR